MEQTLRAEFSEKAACKRIPAVVPRLQIQHLPSLTIHHAAVDRIPSTALAVKPGRLCVRRMPTWPELLLVVCFVGALSAGLNYYMLLRTSVFLDEQMTFVANARAS